MSARNCTEVTPQCPVELTVYGYRPTLAGNTIFCLVFGACGLAQVYLGIKHRTWTWMACLATGCLLESAGYVGRLLMWENAWSRDGFKLQVITLILAPSFVAAGIDLTLKHMALTFGEEWSRIRAGWYTWLFIGIDAFSFLVQGAGGGIAAGGADPTLIDAGNDIILTGIALQVTQLVAFGLVAGEYALRLYQNRGRLGLARLEYARTFDFRFFLGAVLLAYAAVLIRCIYRLPEMAAGWGKGLQRDELDFMVLDGAMVCVAAIALTVAHPGIYFPQLSRNNKKHAESRKDVLLESTEEREYV